MNYTELKLQAELALAAYAPLSAGAPPIADELRGQGFASSQAQIFAESLTTLALRDSGIGFIASRTYTSTNSSK